MEWLDSLLARLLPPTTGYATPSGKFRTFIHKEYVEQSEKEGWYNTADLDSLIRFATMYSEAINAAFFVGNTSIKLVKHWMTGAEMAILPITTSVELQRWVGTFDQKVLRDKLQFYGSDDLDASMNIETLKLQFVKVSVSEAIDYEASVKASGISNDVDVKFSSSKGGDSAKIPAEWKLYIPIYEGCDKEQVTLRCELVKVADGNYKFALTRPYRDAEDKHALEAIQEKLKAVRPTYLGKPQ